MKVVRPTLITDATLTSSSIAENDYPAWSNAGPYVLGNRVIRTTTHSIYEASGAVPANKVPESNPDLWLLVGPTNRWAMFDQSTGSLSSANGTITVTMAPGSVDSLALLEVAALSATVTMKVGGTVVWTQTQSTAAGGTVISDWYEWLFSPVGTRTTLIFDDLPVYPTCTIDVTIDAGTGTVAVGALVVGRQLNLGSTEISPGVGINDFSRKDTNDFGVTTLVERAWSKRMTLRTLLPTNYVDAVQRELAKLRATPALWIGDASFDSLVIYGFYKSFDLDLATVANSYCSLEIEGLIAA